MIRPWLFLLPGAAVALGLYLVYPVVDTFRLSLLDRDRAATSSALATTSGCSASPSFRESMLQQHALADRRAGDRHRLRPGHRGVLTDRIWWGNIAKSLIFMPMAISFVGASVIWKFVYDYRAAGEEQIGILNAIVTGLGLPPQAWITIPFWNNFFLMVILIWIQTGFAMVILSRGAARHPRGDDRGRVHRRRQPAGRSSSRS